jgi:PBP1b-binding outer membrane lipoprotein LpoB
MKKIIGICLFALALVGCDSSVVKEVSVANKSYTITEIALPIHPAMFTASVSIMDSESDRVYTERVAKSCLKNYRVGDNIDMTEGLFSSVNKKGEATYSYGLVEANRSFCKASPLHG